MKILVASLLVVLTSACAVHTDRGRYYERDGVRVYGASAPVQDHELVCHKGKKTMSLPSSAVDAHLRHGDRRGRC